VRRGHLEPLAPLGQRGEAGRHHRLHPGHAGLEQNAELVAAETVRATVAAYRIGQSLAQPRQQSVAGDVAEGVVVLLEPAAVAQSRERVGQRLLATATQHPLVVAEHQCGPGQDQQQRRGGEGERRLVDPGEVVIGE